MSVPHAILVASLRDSLSDFVSAFLHYSPLATGNALTYNGHMDGGFSLWQHPRCSKSVNLPLDAGLILNSLNVNMGRDEAFRLWYDGLAYGL